MSAALPERMEAHTQKSDGCWVWTARIGENGYGRVKVGRQTKLAHRVAYELAVGPIPAGMDLDHECHNRACVRPSHLHPVTRQKNMENRSGAQRNSKSGVRGVHWSADRRKWVAQVGHDGRQYPVGRFDSIEDAERAVIAKRNELFTNNLRDRREL